ncbi:hypothetical protein [Arthrobacter sp. STN4]|uniref:hypothetical protein n=1 Tax=Arthrobacter sp. STN4 TaxID=2923276 RepID=UPI00211A8B80|nr:hypothetical protein [Arthrobacter sp. STN4]MCQ9163004.1 hypothetical protein [Arthrobacter sp. STN4]
MTTAPAFTRESVAAFIRASRAAQGLPPTIDDPAAQRRVLAAIDRVHAAQAREAAAAAKVAAEAA